MNDFQPDRYIGEWHEIARPNHSFERGLNAVSAHYKLLQNGNIEVINWRYYADKKEWIHHEDPRGWFQWHCRYFIGRRFPDDERKIKRWRMMRRHIF